MDWNDYWVCTGMVDFDNFAFIQKPTKSKNKVCTWWTPKAKVAGSWKDYYEEAKEDGSLDPFLGEQDQFVM